MQSDRLLAEPTTYFPFESKLLYENEFGGIGIFRCHPDETRFFGVDYAISDHLIVFPRTSVLITFDAHEPIVANPNVAMIYNRGQIYRRDAISCAGDRCDTFGFAPDLIRKVIHEQRDELAGAGAKQPFLWSHALVDGTVYLLQRQLVEHLLNSAETDHLYLTEGLLTILDRVVAAALHHQTIGNRLQARHPAKKKRAQVALVKAAQQIVCQRYNENVALGEISAELFVSPSYLCRIFRKHTGVTLTKYREQIRIRVALEHLSDSENTITHVAHKLGYSSHSYFSHSFAKAFAVSPSQLTQKQDKILIA